jgi:hypothetical protein
LKIVQFHEATGEALKDSIYDIEKENLILKERVKELEKSLLPRPLFVNPSLLYNHCAVSRMYQKPAPG